MQGSDTGDSLGASEGTDNGLRHDLNDDRAEDQDRSESARTSSVASEASTDMDEVWDRLAELVAGAPGVVTRTEPKKSPDPAELRAQRKRRRLFFGVLDAISLCLWLAFFLKLFVADIDRLFVQAVAPGLLWLLDLRFFLALGALAALLILTRIRKVGWSLLYIAFFPAIVLLWKLPKFIVVNLRKPAIAFGVLNVLTSFILGFKPAVIALACVSLSALLIVLGREPTVIAIGMGLMGVVATVWLFLAIRNGLKPSRFVATQQKWISSIVSWKGLEALRRPADLLAPQNAKMWTTELASQYIGNAGFGLMMYRGAHYWAFSLDRYRMSPSRVIFNGLAILALVVELALAFSFLNYGLFKIDADQYRSAFDPSFLTFLYYSFAASWWGEIAAVAPVGDLAIAIKIANGVLGSVVILTVVVSLFQSYRHARSDSDAIQAIERLREKANWLGEQVGGSFADSLEDLERRLVAIGWGMSGVLNWLGAQVPEDWAPRKQ